MEPDRLLHALTTRTIDLRGEQIVKQLNAAAASESRDALAKTLYANLFNWLVAAINRKIPSYGAPQLFLPFYTYRPGSQIAAGHS